jgi:hypothetical protein
MKKTLVCVVLFGVMLCAGCFPIIVNDTRVGDLVPRLPKDNVEVFTERGNVPWPYKKIAVIVSTENTWFTTIPDQRLIAELVKRAKSIGADGIILLSRTDYPHRYMAEAIVREESNAPVK